MGMCPTPRLNMYLNSTAILRLIAKNKDIYQVTATSNVFLKLMIDVTVCPIIFILFYVFILISVIGAIFTYTHYLGFDKTE